MRLLRLAAVEVALFVLVVLAMVFVHYRQKGPAVGETAMAVVSTATPGTTASSDSSTPAEHPDVLPEETETPTVTADQTLDPKRYLGREAKLQSYEVKRGENNWSVAKKFNIDVQTLIGANPEMPFVSRVKQKLWVLDKRGVLHIVAKGESLKEVAAQYLPKTEDEKARSEALAAKVDELKKANDLSWWRPLRAGDVLFIPGAKPIRMTEAWRNYFSQRGFFGVPFASWGKGWTSQYGQRTDPLTGEKRMHKGMDFKATYGVDVFAAAGGTVAFAGQSGGYGNLIEIRHGNGYTTYYGHLAKIMVRQGQKVRRGTRIGKVGATGRVTGPHLHFEIRKNGRPVNPLPLI